MQAERFTGKEKCTGGQKRHKKFKVEEAEDGVNKYDMKTVYITNELAGIRLSQSSQTLNMIRKLIIKYKWEDKVFMECMLHPTDLI